jgi:hypothetical protein
MGKDRLNNIYERNATWVELSVRWRDGEICAESLTKESGLRCLYCRFGEAMLTVWNGFVRKKANIGFRILWCSRQL